MSSGFLVYKLQLFYEPKLRLVGCKTRLTSLSGSGRPPVILITGARWRRDLLRVSVDSFSFIHNLCSCFLLFTATLLFCQLKTGDRSLIFQNISVAAFIFSKLPLLLSTKCHRLYKANYLLIS